MAKKVSAIPVSGPATPNTNGHACCLIVLPIQREREMAEGSSGYKHDASDRKLDKLAGSEAAAEQAADKQKSPGPGHDAEEIKKHDDLGKDRLFEGRQQHDDAEKNSEKTRLARDVDRHDHPVDDDVADSGSGASAKRKS